MIKTEFARKVYEIVSKIPKGRTMSYKQVAEKAGFPRAFRAVGNLLMKNKDPKIPCYRVIRTDGKLGGPKHRAKSRFRTLKKEGAILKNA